MFQESDELNGFACGRAKWLHCSSISDHHILVRCKIVDVVDEHYYQVRRRLASELS
jgi:hypothetical protein